MAYMVDVLDNGEWSYIAQGGRLFRSKRKAIKWAKRVQNDTGCLVVVSKTTKANGCTYGNWDKQVYVN